MTVAVVAAAAAFVAGCGGSSTSSNGEASKTANQIFADSQQATAAASSVHISGRITSTDGTTTALDEVATHSGGGGTITSNGATFDVVLTGQTVYMKGSAASFAKTSGNSAAGQLLGNRWLRTTTANPDFGDLAKLVNLSDVIRQVQPSGTITKGAATKVNGISVIPLIDHAPDGGTLYVASTGQPYFVQIAKGTRGSLNFDQYGTAKPPAAPKGAVDLDQLEKQG